MSFAQRWRSPGGGLITRNRPIRFRFDGRDYEGYEGDTLASALLANGLRLLGRSFKYHRPRGLMAAGAEEPNVLVRLGSGAQAEVNLRATEIPLREGLVAAPVNCWPSVRFDVGAVSNLLSRFLSAGFYYKTFMWPTWHLYEWAIRRAAGLGTPSAEPDPEFYDTVYAHCDVLVVGGGAAGLAAARAACDRGARVMLVEQDFALGGRLLWDAAPIDGCEAFDWIGKTERYLRAQPETRVLLSTTALGYFDHNEIALIERPAEGAARERMWQVRAKRVILATGALERPLVFPGNDRPGVMLAQSVRHYLRRFAVRPGARALIVTNNDDAYETATALQEAGVAVACVADLRANPPLSNFGKLASLGVETLSGAEVVETYGRPELSAVRLRANGVEKRIACDLLAMSGGFNPTVHLFTQSGGRLVYDETAACFVPGEGPQAQISVGAAAGEFSFARALRKAHDAGVAAAAEAGRARMSGGSAPVAAEAETPSPTGAQQRPAKGKAFVDFQNDVTADDVAQAARENLVSVEHLKRYTTQGMAIDQGKTSNVNAIALMADLTGRTVTETGTTRNRFPYTPTAIGAFNGFARGECFRPFRTLAAHDWHAAQGALFEDYGGWMRPSCYPRESESRAAAEQREARVVREGVGLFDGSPLGKIEVTGRDAPKFLNRIYANNIATLKPGMLRYGLMLNELGVLIDDGITARFTEDRFLVGTTGAGAGRIANWLEEWLQCEWPDLDVVVAPVTTSKVVFTLSGPRARDVLAAAGTDIALGPAEFPHMAFRTGTVCGIPAEVFRVSFTGEMSYEINVGTRYAGSLAAKLTAAGAPLGIAPVGIDAWMLLRTEKGYLHIGADTDGSTVPDDVGWGHVVRKAGDFVGKRSLLMPDNRRADRLQLVGLEVLAQTSLPVGTHLSAKSEPRTSAGHVTSSGFSPTLQRPVALAMISAGRARMGEILTAHAGNALVKARVSPNCFYDPEGARLDA